MDDSHSITNDQLCIEMNPYDAFVLHAEDDEHFAREIVSQMSARGLTVNISIYIDKLPTSDIYFFKHVYL